ncbi:SDR family NAD(P)-dependent oxidoreductase [Ruicaihuangia caeni]|uniref:SDR family NAD(P)-dependent oxidoreductase n=1 Tax=Ruicaihuangia caeni TaxID=3042517 RepID=UPI0033900298
MTAVIITGAAGGMGQEIARTLAREPLSGAENARLALVGRRVESMKGLAAELSDLGAEVELIGADLAEPDAAALVVDATISRFGELSGIVSAAGTMAQRPLMELELDEWEYNFAVNTRPTWLLAKAAYPHLAETRGSLVAISSTSGHHPATPLGAYSASKAAVLILVKQLAYEWGPAGVRANTVSPGMIMTPMSPAAKNEELRRWREETIPLRRLGDPQDIADAVAFLLGDRSKYITGEDLVVDGGMRSGFVPRATGLA